MEVHHPHSKGAKHLKEHFLEFLMLFLAVTLGFFAENLRDQYIEKERAHEYLEHLEADVNKNIHYIDSLTERDHQMIKRFDSAFLYLATAKEVDLDSLYKNLPVNVFRFLSKNDTYEQMKSSGSLRYIKDQHLLDLIMEYSNAAQAAESRSTQMETEFTTTHWMTVVSAYMPEDFSINELKRVRRGNLIIFQDDAINKALVDEQYVQIEKELNSIPNRNDVLKGEALKQLKNKLMPFLVRRQALVVNTIKFMNAAKEKGAELKKYIAEQH